MTNASEGNDPSIIDVSDKGINVMDESGVSGMIPFHVTLKTGKQMPFTALGKRNLEFRRHEATKGGWTMDECSKGGCTHG